MISFPLLMSTYCPSRTLARTGSYSLKNQLSSPFPKLEQCVPINSPLAPLPDSIVPGHLPTIFSYINSIGTPAGISPSLETAHLKAGMHSLTIYHSFRASVSSYWYLYDVYPTSQKLEQVSWCSEVGARRCWMQIHILSFSSNMILG